MRCLKCLKKINIDTYECKYCFNLFCDKIQTIEKWRWMIMGGALVVGYVLAHLKLEKLF